MGKVIAVLLILPLGAGSWNLASAAVDTTVSIGPKLQAGASIYGADALDQLREALKAELDADVSTAGATQIHIVIEDAVPNRPTARQLREIPGLSSTGAIALGGATITGSVQGASGNSQPVRYSWYETDLREHDNSAIWAGARRAIRQLADNINQGRPLDTGGPRPGSSAGEFGYPDFRGTSQTQSKPPEVSGPAPFDAHLQYPPGSPEAFAEALGQQLAQPGKVAWPPKRWPRAVGFDPALVQRLDAGTYTDEERRNLLATAAWLTVHGPPRQQAMPHTADEITRRRGFAELEMVYGENGYLFSGQPTDSINDRVDLVEDIIAKGDTVWVRWRMHGHHTGYIFGLPPDGKEMDLHEIAILRYRHGALIYNEAIGDTMALWIQAGGKLDLKTAHSGK